MADTSLTPASFVPDDTPASFIPDERKPVEFTPDQQERIDKRWALANELDFQRQVGQAIDLALKLPEIPGAAMQKMDKPFGKQDFSYLQPLPEGPYGALTPKEQATIEEQEEVEALRTRISEVSHPARTGLTRTAASVAQAATTPSGVGMLAATMVAPEIMGPVWLGLGAHGLRESVKQIKEARDEGDSIKYYEGVGNLAVNLGMAAGGAKGTPGFKTAVTRLEGALPRDLKFGTEPMTEQIADAGLPATAEALKQIPTAQQLEAVRGRPVPVPEGVPIATSGPREIGPVRETPAAEVVGAEPAVVGAEPATVPITPKAEAVKVSDALTAEEQAQARAQLEAEVPAAQPLTPEERAAPWFEQSGEPAKQRIFAAMRSIQERVDAASARERELRPPQGSIAVGATGFDEFIRAESQAEVLTAIRRGETPDAAEATAKTFAREAIAKHNAKRPKDQNWQRWEGTADNIIERTAGELRRAAEAPQPAAQPVTAQERGAPPAPAELGQPRIVEPASLSKEEYGRLVQGEKPVAAATELDNGVILQAAAHPLITIPRGRTVTSEGFVTNKGRYVRRDEAAMLTGGNYWEDVLKGAQEGAAESIVGHTPTAKIEWEKFYEQRKLAAPAEPAKPAPEAPAAAVEGTKAQLIEELIGKKPPQTVANVDARVRWERDKKTFSRFSRDELQQRVTQQREQQRSERGIQAQYESLAPEIKKLAEDAGNRWRKALKQRADQEVVRFSPPMESSRGEAVHTLTRAIAEKRSKSPPTEGAPPAAPEFGGPGAAATREFETATAEPVPIPPPPRRTIAERVRAVVDKAIAKPQGADTPIATDVTTPLPDFQPHPKSKAIFSQPFGFERVPVLGAVLMGGKRRLKGNVPESVVTYHAERSVGQSIASALAQEYSWLDAPFKIKDGQIINIGRSTEGQSLFISDVFEALQKNPEAYKLSVAQRQAFDALQLLEADFQKLGEKYGLGRVVDNEGAGVDQMFDAPTPDAKTYFPRIVVQHPATTQLRRGQAPGSKVFFEKPRMFESEAEGWSKGYQYETSIAKRVASRAERLYKRIADKRIARDSDLGGITRSQLDAQLKEVYAEELGSGEMTAEKLGKIGDSIEAAGRVWQPAFFNKIFPRETAEALNKAFPNTQSTLRYHAANVNNALKGLWLGFDLGVGFIQGQGLMFYNPKVWARANVNSLRAWASRNFFPEYVRRNLDPIRELSQLGSSVGRLEEMMAGLERGELLHRIPLVKQTVGRAITPFARQFQTFLDTAKVELWKGLREVTPREEWGRAAQSLESILNTARMESVGISSTRALTERALFIAPSYYRGALNLIASMAERGVSGQVARRAIGSWLAGGAILYYGVAKALGMSNDEIAQRFDPRRSDFLMWRVKMGDRNTEVGFGGIFKSLLRLAGNMAKTSLENPDNWKSLTSEKNPISRWYRGHAGPVVGLTWDMMTGRDYLGREAGLEPSQLQRLLPMTARSMMDPDQPLNPLDAGASFIGLSSFERANEAEQEIGRLANQFLIGKQISRPKLERPAYEEPVYSNLRHALRTKNDERALKILAGLKVTRTQKQIEKAMGEYINHPFTGSLEREREFIATLDPEHKRMYIKAREERMNVLRDFYRLMARSQKKGMK